MFQRYGTIQMLKVQPGKISKLEDVVEVAG
jgi:hypothetical protein